MLTLDITTLLSPDLKSRNAVSDLLTYVKSLQDNHIQIDFSKVEFATRSFIDEYYNTFIHDHGKLEGFKVETINLPDDIKYMFNVVSRTQTGKRIYEDPVNATIKRFSTDEEAIEYLRSLNF